MKVYFTTGQVAKALGVSRRVVMLMVEQGRVAPLFTDKGTGTRRGWLLQDMAELLIILELKEMYNGRQYNGACFVNIDMVGARNWAMKLVDRAPD